MANPEYVFDETREHAEHERLRAIEAVFDPATKTRLEAVGLSPGWQCLEVGAGGGSIMRWLAERVGSGGRVVAVETNPRFLEGANRSNTEVMTADIRAVDLGADHFDLIHGRYVLLHVPDYRTALQRMVRLLKPGGWLVLEEPDFSAAQPVHGTAEACRAVQKVNRAIQKMYEQRGIDHAMGLRLPGTLHGLGIDDFRVDHEAPIARGQSGMARMMRMSAEQLRDKYIETGEANPEDVNAYCAFAEDSSTWAIYYATIAVTAQCHKGQTGVV